MKFGLIYSFQVPPGSGATHAQLWKDALREADLAEKLGYDSITLVEHHFLDDGMNPSLFVSAAAIAARTEHVKVGTSCYLLPLHHPIETAENAAVLDNISQGRLIMGVAAAYRDEEFKGFGISRAERGAKMEEDGRRQGEVARRPRLPLLRVSQGEVHRGEHEDRRRPGRDVLQAPRRQPPALLDRSPRHVPREGREINHALRERCGALFPLTTRADAVFIYGRGTANRGGRPCERETVPGGSQGRRGNDRSGLSWPPRLLGHRHPSLRSSRRLQPEARQRLSRERSRRGHSRGDGRDVLSEGEGRPRLRCHGGRHAADPWGEARPHVGELPREGGRGAQSQNRGDGRLQGIRGRR